MNKQQWLRKVADQAAAVLSSSTLAEAAGLMNDEEVEALSDAEAERAEWAVTEVLRRLDKMGRK
jgi:hypothetical protein